MPNSPTEELIANLKSAVRDVSDFPKKGICFKDIAPLLQDPSLFKQTISLFERAFKDEKIDKIVAIDARGFIFGAALAERLELGFIPIRKKGKLPWKTYEEAYELEYGEAIVEIHQDAVSPGERVLLVDDLLATGGTAAAACKLLKKLDAEIVAVAFLIELTFLEARKKFTDVSVVSFLQY